MRILIVDGDPSVARALIRLASSILVSLGQLDSLLVEMPSEDMALAELDKADMVIISMDSLPKAEVIRTALEMGITVALFGDEESLEEIGPETPLLKTLPWPGLPYQKLMSIIRELCPGAAGGDDQIAFAA
ncbi:MAG: hypothetical protein KGI69_03605 [Patescibacteria group bacterium]|nr:hypothetical protein [Patescibacteria group bacterium]